MKNPNPPKKPWRVLTLEEIVPALEFLLNGRHAPRDSRVTGENHNYTPDDPDFHFRWRVSPADLQQPAYDLTEVLS